MTNKNNSLQAQWYKDINKNFNKNKRDMTTEGMRTEELKDQQLHKLNLKIDVKVCYSLK